MAQLAARRSHNPKVAGSIPVESTYVSVSLGGQDTRLSPERPGFNSRTENFLKTFFEKLFTGTGFRKLFLKLFTEARKLFTEARQENFLPRPG